MSKLIGRTVRVKSHVNKGVEGPWIMAGDVCRIIELTEENHIRVERVHDGLVDGGYKSFFKYLNNKPVV